MLNGGKPAVADSQGRAEPGVSHLLGMKQNGQALGLVEPSNPEAGMLAGQQAHKAILAAVETHTAALHSAGESQAAAVVGRPVHALELKANAHIEAPIARQILTGHLKAQGANRCCDDHTCTH